MIINVGCGMRPTQGALNCDNSFSVYLSRHRALLWLFRSFRLLSKENLDCAQFARQNGIVHRNCTRLKIADNCADVVYASHMMEHLSRPEARRFLAEARRVLKPDGILRLVLPDMRLLVEAYLGDHDCDQFVERTLLANESDGTFGWHVRLLLFGYRGHRWMYDVPSAIALLAENGFTDIHALNAGETIIPEPGHLDLSERAEESLYIEARPA